MEFLTRRGWNVKDELAITLIGEGNESELDELRIDLADELSHLDVSEIRELSLGESPDGSKAVDAAAIGVLIVKLGPAALNKVVTTVRDWFRRASATEIELEIDGDRIRLSKASQAEQDRLLALFEAKHLRNG
jgi:hypothetical protein